MAKSSLNFLFDFTWLTNFHPLRNWFRTSRTVLTISRETLSRPAAKPSRSRERNQQTRSTHDAERHGMVRPEPTQMWSSGTLSAFEKIFVPKIGIPVRVIRITKQIASTYVSRFPPSITVCIGRYPSFLGGLFLYLLFLNLFLTMAKKSSTSSPEVVFEKKTGRRDFSLLLHTLGSFTNDHRPGNARKQWFDWLNDEK